jgi:hypothetical protein
MGKLYGALASLKKKSIIKWPCKHEKTILKTSKGKIQQKIERNCFTSSSKHSYDGKS